MGMYDTILIPCPNCGQISDTQTKSGECILRVWAMEEAPADALRDVNRHAPFECARCNTVFHVEDYIALEGAPKPRTVADKVGFEMKPIPDYGDLLTMGKFIDSVHEGYLIDYDGYGYYSDGERIIELPVYPMDVLFGKVNTSWSHVVWLNR